MNLFAALSSDGVYKKTNYNDRLYEVELKLTAGDDQQLRTLTKYIREEVAGATGCVRLSTLLIKIEQFDKAEEMDKILLDLASDESKKALPIFQKTLPPNHPSLTASYSNTALLYHNMSNCSKALSFHRHALNIWQLLLTSNHPQPVNVRTSIKIVKKKL
jgi:tetratricopeptide (TPR) repeat protein